jgi:hypothetical protein
MGCHVEPRAKDEQNRIPIPEWFVDQRQREPIEHNHRQVKEHIRDEDGPADGITPGYLYEIFDGETEGCPNAIEESSDP